MMITRRGGKIEEETDKFNKTQDWLAKGYRYIE